MPAEAFGRFTLAKSSHFSVFHNSANASNPSMVSIRSSISPFGATRIVGHIGHRIGRCVDDRHGVRAPVRDVGVLREALGAAERAGNGKGRDRDQPENAEFHGIPLFRGRKAQINCWWNASRVSNEINHYSASDA
jgi:hypothetical protein